MKKYILSFLLFTASFSAFAQINFQKIDTLVNRLDSNNRWMGSVAISEQGKTIYSVTKGFADIEKGIKANENTKYRIGSISKTFTATLIFKAIEEKKLNLETTLAKFYPQVKNANTITVAHLLQHRSGIFNITNTPEYLTWFTAKKSEQELITIINGLASDFEPGQKAAYSNTNYILLSFILEKVYKKPYTKILEKKITKPLNLKYTGFGTKISTEKNEAFSYIMKEKWMKSDETDTSIPMGAGGIVSTPGDLNKFIEGLFNGKLVSESSLAQMMTIKDNFGMGLVKIPFGNKTFYGHSGVIDGFTASMAYNPADKLAVSITSNGHSYTNNELVIAALSNYYKLPFKLPNFNSVQLSAQDIEPFVGEYSSSTFPLKITISRKENVLVAQATGQSSFTLTAIAKNKFEFAPAGITLEFNASTKQMILKQGPGTYTLTKP